MGGRSRDKVKEIIATGQLKGNALKMADERTRIQMTFEKARYPITLPVFPARIVVRERESLALYYVIYSASVFRLLWFRKFKLICSLTEA
jgi:hypothetical protein